MLAHDVRTRRSADDFPRTEHLAWKIAEVAADPVDVPAEVEAMVVNRIIDNAAVSAASVTRRPVTVARAQAQANRNKNGATVFGVDGTYSPEWAAWANGVAVRELDFHDTFLAAEYSHPGDNIPALVAVAQQLGVRGADLVRGIATAYEVQMDLVRGICLHEHKIDHVAHLGPSVAAGLGTMLRLDPETIYAAIGQALHLTTATRQSRKGQISSWKAFAPAHAGKVAIEAVDRAMRGEGSPSPIWEGEDGVISWLLSGPDHTYAVPLPAAGEPKRAILDSYTKEHSAEYQSQAPIDLARRMRGRIGDLDQIATIIAAHQPSHARGHRHGQQRPAEVRSRRIARNTGPLGDVRLRRRAAGRRLAPRTVLRPGTRTPVRHHRAVAQDLAPSKTRSGPAVTTRATRPRRHSARGPRSRSRTARSSPTSSPWPTHTRSAPARSAANSTSPSLPNSPTVSSTRPSSSASCPSSTVCRNLKPGALRSLNVIVDPRVLDKAPTIPSGIFR